jgi:hypothetical protein
MPKQNQKLLDYVVSCINSEGYNVTLETEKDKIKFLIDTFKKEYCFKENLRYYGGFQKTFENWLMGLPSAFNIDYENHRILELYSYKELDLPFQDTEKGREKALQQWWGRVYMAVVFLARRHKLDFYMY